MSEQAPSASGSGGGKRPRGRPLKTTVDEDEAAIVSHAMLSSDSCQEAEYETETKSTCSKGAAGVSEA